MIKKFYDKRPALHGIIYGQGLFIFFVLLEYFFVTTGLSECGVIVDSFIRVVFGVIALILMKAIYQGGFSQRFNEKIPKRTWLFCIPFFLYLGLQFLYFPIAESLTTAYVSVFLLSCVQQLATGFFEETASKGLIMSGMFSRWGNAVWGRLGMVLICGLLFGSTHILNVLFTGDIIACLWQALYSGAFGTFLAAIYLRSENIGLCIALHTIWDIIIRIPIFFCEDINEGILSNVLYRAQDVLELGIFPIMALLICLKYKPSSKNDLIL